MKYPINNIRKLIPSVLNGLSQTLTSLMFGLYKLKPIPIYRVSRSVYMKDDRIRD